MWLGRPLAYSTLADLVHHVRQSLSLSDLALAVNLFSKNVHDESLPCSIQTMSCKLLLNLVECIRAKSEAENGNVSHISGIMPMWPGSGSPKYFQEMKKLFLYKNICKGKGRERGGEGHTPLAAVLLIIYLLITPKQPNRRTHIQKTIKAANIKDKKTLKKTYTTDTANVFHTDFLIKDTELSNR